MTLTFSSLRTATRRLALIILSAPLLSSFGATVTNFSDITYWVGSGSNQAALVIDWNDGVAPVSLAWGFRWDGIATGEDMLKAIAGASLSTFDNSLVATGADIHLTIYLTTYSFGDAVDRITYETLHDQGGFSDGGYWEYDNMGGQFDTPPDGDPNTFAGSASYPGTNGTPDWISSWTGFSDRQLTNGSWDGWSYAVGGISQSIDQPISAVPEPGAWILVAFGAGVLIVLRRARCAKVRSA